MRVALASYDVQRGGGQGRVNYELTRSLLAAGHAVTLFTAEAAPDLLEAGALWVPIVPKAHGVDLFRFYEFARRTDAALKKAGGKRAFDIIHGCGFSLSVPHHVNSSHFVHDAWRRSPVHTSRFRRDAYGAYQWAFSALNARWEKRAYEKALRVVAVSENVRRELITSGVNADRIEVIFNGVNTNEFQPGAFDRSALGLPPLSVPLALFAGELQTPRKNLDTVLRALALTPGVHLAVAGETAGSPYPTLAAQLGVADRTHFLGYRRDVADLMRAADVFVFPSRYEACSLVLLEAVASGLPVLTARSTGGAEALGDACSIRLENSDDADALADALKAVIFDKPRLGAMKRAARETALTMRWSDMGARYLATYQDVVAGAAT